MGLIWLLCVDFYLILLGFAKLKYLCVHKCKYLKRPGTILESFGANVELV